MTRRRIDMLPVWTDAYLADTTHLGLEHHGAYFLLLQKAWRSGTCDLPDDDMFLRNTLSITQKKWKAIRPVLEPFFKIENGRWKHKRLSVEWDKAQRLASQKEDRKRKKGSPKGQGEDPKKTNENNDSDDPYARAEAGAGAGAITPNSKSYTPPPPLVSDEPQDGGGGDLDGFDEWWNAYPATAGHSRERAQAEWLGLSVEDRRKARSSLASLSDQLAKMDGGGFIPFVFLRDRVFDRADEAAKPAARPPRPDDPAAAALFDAVGEKHGVYVAWFAPDKVTFDGFKLHPPTAFHGKHISTRFKAYLAAAGVTVGEVRAKPQDERKAA